MFVSKKCRTRLQNVLAALLALFPKPMTSQVAVGSVGRVVFTTNSLSVLSFLPHRMTLVVVDCRWFLAG